MNPSEAPGAPQASKPVGRPRTRPCGTVAAYKRHQRRKEQPCDECKAAWAEWQRTYYAKRHGIA